MSNQKIGAQVAYARMGNGERRESAIHPSLRGRPTHRNESWLALLDKEAASAGLDRPFPSACFPPPDNGERFLHEAFEQGLQRRAGGLAKSSLNDRCQCVECALNPLRLPHDITDMNCEPERSELLKVAAQLVLPDVVKNTSDKCMDTVNPIDEGKAPRDNGVTDILFMSQKMPSVPIYPPAGQPRSLDQPRVHMPLTTAQVLLPSGKQSFEASLGSGLIVPYAYPAAGWPPFAYCGGVPFPFAWHAATTVGCDSAQETTTTAPLL